MSRNKQDDKKKRELVDARNTADALIYSTEKSMKELGDKIDATTKEQVESAMEALRKVMDGDNADEIKRLSEELTQASHKLAEAMYQKASAEDAQQAGAQPGAEDAAQADSSAAEEDVVDADFEEVKDDKRK